MNRAQRKAMTADIVESLRSRPARNLLSLFAIAIGAAALAVLLAILGGLEQRARQLVDELGGNVAVLIAPGETRQGGSARFDEKHLRALAANLPGSRVSALRTHRIALPGSGEPLAVVATDEQLAGIRRWPLLAGRWLDPRDVAHRERHLVASSALAGQLHWKPGDIVVLENTPWVVVGIVANGGQAADAQLGHASLLPGERSVFIPHTASPYWAGDPRSAQPGFDALFVAVAGNLDAAVAGMQRLFDDPALALPGMSLVTPESLVRGIRELQEMIGLTVGSIAALCLVLGGATLASLMIASVRERITEIGLRRALGATRADIVQLFVLEALALTLVAGTLGALLANLLLWPARNEFPVPLAPGIASLLAPVLAAVVVGALFASWPAAGAARISPAEALRND
jgi:putative ABC transport system permease protein